jgi:hypothetical protein
MLDQHTTTQVADKVTQYSFWQTVSAVVAAAFAGGFFNPIWKYLKGKVVKKKHAVDPEVKIAEIKKEGHTEDKLWERVENLEKNLKEEIDKRLASEKVQGELQRQIDELKREKLFTLSRYIHLKLRIEEAKREIQYLKAKLMEKDPDFDKDYPNFSMDSRALEDENLINEIINDNTAKNGGK